MKYQELLEYGTEQEVLDQKALRSKQVAYAAKLKKQLSKDFGIKLKSKVIKTKGDAFIEIFVANFGKDVIPNDFRLMIAKALNFKNLLSSEDVQYGNIRSNSIALKHSEWQKVVPIKEEATDGATSAASIAPTESTCNKKKKS